MSIDAERPATQSQFSLSSIVTPNIPEREGISITAACVNPETRKAKIRGIFIPDKIRVLTTSY